METVIQDLRYAARALARSPAFVTITVLTLALGIGANVAIFTLVNAVLLQPLPFSQPERLVRLFDDLNGAGATDVGMSVPELEDLRARSDVFEQISAIWPVSTALTGGERAERGGDYWVFGGIYRPVFLEATPMYGVDRVAIDGRVLRY